MYIDLLDLFGKLRVTPNILPGNFGLYGDIMGGGLPAIIRSWISSGSSMIVEPLLILPLPFLFSLVPRWKMVCSRIVVFCIPSFHASWMQYPLINFSIFILMVFSNLSSPWRPCTFWFSMVHVYGQVSPGLVVVHAPCPVDCKSYSAAVDFHYGKSEDGCFLLKCGKTSWWFWVGRLQWTSCPIPIDCVSDIGLFQVAGLITREISLRWPWRGQSQADLVLSGMTINYGFIHRFLCIIT